MIYKAFPLLILLFSGTVGAQDTTRYLIHAGRLFDAESAAFLENRFVFVVNDRIEAVTDADGDEHAGYTRIDLSDATVTPGLIDAHTHLLFMQRSNVPMEQDIIQHTDHERILRGAERARTWLEAGVTTVRDLGNSGTYLDIPLRKALQEGWIDGPRLFASGPIISPPGGQFDDLPYYHEPIVAKEYAIVRTVEEARREVADHAAAGVDVIKICATNDHGLTLSVEEMTAMVEEARRHGLRVTAHATYDDVIRDAVRAGVDGIEHGYSVNDETLRMMADSGVYLVPTDGTAEGYIHIFEAGPDIEISEENVRNWVASSQDRLRRAIAAGVEIVWGSDMYLESTDPPGWAAVTGLVSYAEAGIPTVDVLQYATRNGARALGRDDLGVVRAGALADLVAFRGDLEGAFAATLQDGLVFVMRDGRIHIQD
ncbi:metal-dependent hydrolase family protein [Lewinella sp. IMCC34191]|uniref:amidohydrolase family protein n=1 Tax=Lewinella sp. IMCC34191 TaxID=2259172 RepID=UPI000E27E27C|nr:amidohydrolase family protein [Lewinella sp. IMCC34191]